MGHGGDAAASAPPPAARNMYRPQETSANGDNTDDLIQPNDPLPLENFPGLGPGLARSQPRTVQSQALGQIFSRNDDTLRAATSADISGGEDAIRPVPTNVPHHSPAVSPASYTSTQKPPIHPSSPTAMTTAGLSTARLSKAALIRHRSREKIAPPHNAPHTFHEGDPLATRDSVLAGQLQRRIAAELSNSTTALAQLTPCSDIPATEAPPSYLDQDDTRTTLIANLKQQVVPALIQYLSSAVFPDITRENGLVTYDLRNMRLKHFVVPDSSLAVMHAGGWLQIHFVDLDLQLEIGQWAYKRATIFGSSIGDSGSAIAEVGKVHISIRLYPTENPTQHTVDDEDDLDQPPSLAVRDAKVSAQTVNIVFGSQGFTPAWIYNALAVVMRPVVLAMVKDVLRGATISGLRSQAESGGAG